MGALHNSLLLARVYCAMLSFVGAQEEELKATLEIDGPDCLNRNVVYVNGYGPGKHPPLRFTAGEKVNLTVINELEGVSITMHWHGIDQVNTPWADGTANINACPLRPGDSHLMEFDVPRVPGTYFWHGHLSVGNAMGMSGLLLVDWPAEGPKFDQRIGSYYLHNGEPWPEKLQIPLFLSDWFNAPGLAVVTGLTSVDFLWPGNANSLLVNGFGQPNCSVTLTPSGADAPSPLTMVRGYQACGGFQHKGTQYEACLRKLCEDCSRDNVFETKVDADETYMLRIVNGAMLMMMNVYVENHTMTVVELDGWPVDPIEVPSLDLGTGQRAGVLIKTDQPPNAYWISIKYRARDSPVIGRAILRYKGYEDKPDISRLFGEVQSHHPEWWDTDFSFKQQRNFSANHRDMKKYGWAYPDFVPPDRRIVLLNSQERFKAGGAQNHIPSSQSGLDTTRIGKGSELPSNYCEAGDNAFLRWGVARVNFEWPSTPLLQALYFQTADLAAYTQERGFYEMELNKTYEVVIQDFPACNGVCESHPWHMHGTHFWHVGTWRGTYNGSYDEGTGGGHYLRDTIQVVGQNTSSNMSPWGNSNAGVSEGCGFTVIRFKANNPGAWPFHCHIEWHFAIGMFTTFYTASDTIPPPPRGYYRFNHKCGDVPLRNDAVGFLRGIKEEHPYLLPLAVVSGSLVIIICGLLIGLWKGYMTHVSRQAASQQEIAERRHDADVAKEEAKTIAKTVDEANAAAKAAEKRALEAEELVRACESKIKELETKGVSHTASENPVRLCL